MQVGLFKTFDDKNTLRKYLQLLTSKVIAAGSALFERLRPIVVLDL
jgi:hypothetical protein